MSIIPRDQHIVDKLAEKYSDATDELNGLVKLILTFAGEYFADCRGTVVKFFFTLKPLNDHAGYCKKLDNAVRFKLGVDFFVILDKKEFDDTNRIGKAKLIIHELHHIGRDDKGQPVIRNHNERENFCELPTHDLFSENVVQKLRDRLTQPALEGEIVETVT